MANIREGWFLNLCMSIIGTLLVAIVVLYSKNISSDLDAHAKLTEIKLTLISKEIEELKQSTRQNTSFMHERAQQITNLEFQVKRLAEDFKAVSIP